MSPLFLVAGAGFIAGMMNALAGGGSFVTLPALIAAGVPSVNANTTSTVALYPGQLTSSWAYRDGLGPIGSVPLRSLVIVTFFGGALGAVLLLRTPIKTFDVVLPWLMAIATVALALGSRLGEILRRRWRIGATAVLGAQFCLGIYGGYFGGGVGIMMMAVWSLLSDRTLKSFNAPRTLARERRQCYRGADFHRSARRSLARSVGDAGDSDAWRLLRVAHRPPRAGRVIRAATVWLSIGITLAFFVRAYLK